MIYGTVEEKSESKKGDNDVEEDRRVQKRKSG